MNKVKLITHNDLDGVACAIVALVKYPDADISFCSYDDVNDVATETFKNHHQYSRIILSDISVNETVANMLDSIGSKVDLVDHHMSAEWLNEYEWAMVMPDDDGVKNAGVNLLFDLLFDTDTYTDTLESFVEMVRRYDTWEWANVYKDNTPARLNSLLFTIGRDRFINSMMHKISMNYSIFSGLDNTILDVIESQKQAYIQNKLKDVISVKFFGYSTGMVSADSHISELGNEIAKNGYDIGMILSQSGNMVKYSLRSIGDIDVSWMAKKYGGGGHKNAAGFSLSIADAVAMMNLGNIGMR